MYFLLFCRGRSKLKEITDNTICKRWHTHSLHSRRTVTSCWPTKQSNPAKANAAKCNNVTTLTDDGHKWWKPSSAISFWLVCTSFQKNSIPESVPVPEEENRRIPGDTPKQGSKLTPTWILKCVKLFLDSVHFYLQKRKRKSRLLEPFS